MSGFRRGRAEPRLRIERVAGLEQVLSSIPEPYAIAVLARLLYGASNEAIGERLGVEPESVHVLFGKGLSMLRHPMWAAVWTEYFDTDGQAVVLVDEGLRGLIRKWRLEGFASECPQCRRRYAPEELRRTRWGGRPRQYCSNACRQKAYRERHR
ncbi:hypothetical protein [Streptomyces sp. N2A]|uniref:hypothetical protein n=1 Tax=Streptomyces sp. N2A TaxID=3073936 RepID=UPI0028701718|nr:hypothetical protein [Streptomyces sp. N2A]